MDNITQELDEADPYDEDTWNHFEEQHFLQKLVVMKLKKSTYNATKRALLDEKIVRQRKKVEQAENDWRSCEEQSSREELESHYHEQLKEVKSLESKTGAVVYHEKKLMKFHAKTMKELPKLTKFSKETISTTKNGPPLLRSRII